MIHTMTETGLWYELTRMCRSDIILDQVEEWLLAQGVKRDHWLWMIWEEMCEQQMTLETRLLTEIAAYDRGEPVNWRSLYEVHDTTWGISSSPKPPSDGGA